MKCFAKTDLGKARELNEDSYYIPSDENELRIYMLADGMGGYNGGEIGWKGSAGKSGTVRWHGCKHDWRKEEYHHCEYGIHRCCDVQSSDCFKA